MKRQKRTRTNQKPPQQEITAVASPGRGAVCSLWGNPYWHALLILVLGFLVYARTFSVPFLFDDFPYLVSNPAIRDFSFFTDPDKLLNLALFPDVKNNFLLRPAAYFSFALNYAVDGLDVQGYHVVNMLLHLGNGLLVYLLCRLIVAPPATAASGVTTDSRDPDTARYLPLFCALLFTVHPLQTQSVTYIIQRFVPLCSFFTLSSLVLYGYAHLASRQTVRILCYSGSLVACSLAMLSKEIAFTFPLVIALYDILFLEGTPGKRAVRLFPFMMTMAIIPYNISRTVTFNPDDESGAVSDALNLVNFSDTSSWHYLITQFGVITEYLRLLLLPVNQNLDYDYQLQTEFFTPAVLLQLTLLLSIAGYGIWQGLISRRSKQPVSVLQALTAFGIFWFFATLAVTSSIVPIDDLISEDRVYLPSIGIIMATLSGAALLYEHRHRGKSLFSSRIATVIIALAVTGYFVAGHMRNHVWEDKVEFWRDVVSKSPKKARPHYRLGLALLEEPLMNRSLLEQLKTIIDPSTLGIPFPMPSLGTSMQISPENRMLVDEAIGEFRTFIRLRPNSQSGHLELGDALLLRGDEDKAANEYARALALRPKAFQPYLSIGHMNESRGDYETARLNYQKAVSLEPKASMPHMSLAGLNAKEGNYPAALKEYEIVWQLFPDNEVRKKIEEMKANMTK